MNFKTSKYICLILLLTILGCGNHHSNEPLIADNSNTNKRINYPGTRVYFVPPPGYTLNHGPDGILTYKSGSGINDIQVSDKKGVAFKPFSQEQYTASNPAIKIQKLERTKVNGYDGLYLEQSSFLPGYSIMLLFGDSTFQVIISVQVDKPGAAVIVEIRKSFQTVSYDRNKIISPYENALFTIDDSKSNYKFTRTMGEAFIFTSDSNLSDNYTIKDNCFIATPVTASELPSFETFIDQSTPKLKEKGATNIKTSAIKTEVHDKITIMEAEITYETDGGKKITYTALANNNKDRVLLIGVCHDNFEQSIRDFKTLCRSLTFNDPLR